VGEAVGSAMVDSAAEMIVEIAGGAEVDVEIAAGSAVRVRIVNGVEAEVESGEGVNGAEGGREVVESAESVAMAEILKMLRLPIASSSVTLLCHHTT